MKNIKNILVAHKLTEEVLNVEKDVFKYGIEEGAKSKVKEIFEDKLFENLLRYADYESRLSNFRLLKQKHEVKNG